MNIDYNYYNNLPLLYGLTTRITLIIYLLLSFNEICFNFKQ